MNSNIEALLLLFVERRRPDVGNRRKVVPRPYGTVALVDPAGYPSLLPECCCWGKSCEKLWQGSLSTVDQKSVREVPPYDEWISSKSFFKTPEIVLKKGPFFKTISGRFEDIFKKSGFQNYSNRGTNPIFEDIFKNTYLQNYSNRGLSELYQSIGTQKYQCTRTVFLGCATLATCNRTGIALSPSSQMREGSDE